MPPPPTDRADLGSQRDETVRELLEAIKAMDRITAECNAAPDEDAPAILEGLDEAHRRVMALYDAYQDGLPWPAISRCPFSGRVIRQPIDTFGLDGPWWDHERPARPIVDQTDTLFAVTGAVHIEGEPPVTPFLCKPGPGAPYVAPRLFASPEVRAVVSSLLVGRHIAYPVIYFAQDTPWDLARINTWGLDHYSAELPHGEGYSVSVADDPRDFDFDLEFYIRSGRLLWIAPGDETLTLRSTVEACPYLGLPGSRRPVGLRDGVMWDSLVILPEEVLTP